MQTLLKAQDRRDKRSDDKQQRTNILKAQLARNPKFRDGLTTIFRRKIPIPYYPLPVFSSLDPAEQMNLVNESFTQLRLG
jgi:hypothetical protein